MANAIRSGVYAGDPRENYNLNDLLGEIQQTWQPGSHVWEVEGAGDVDQIVGIQEAEKIVQLFKRHFPENREVAYSGVAAIGLGGGGIGLLRGGGFFSGVLGAVAVAGAAFLGGFAKDGYKMGVCIKKLDRIMGEFKEAVREKPADDKLNAKRKHWDWEIGQIKEVLQKELTLLRFELYQEDVLYHRPFTQVFEWIDFGRFFRQQGGRDENSDLGARPLRAAAQLVLPRRRGDYGVREGGAARGY